jgi:hypothetical protein
VYAQKLFVFRPAQHAAFAAAATASAVGSAAVPCPQRGHPASAPGLISNRCSTNASPANFAAVPANIPAVSRRSSAAKLTDRRVLGSYDVTDEDALLTITPVVRRKAPCCCCGGGPFCCFCCRRRRRRRRKDCGKNCGRTVSRAVCCVPPPTAAARQLPVRRVEPTPSRRSVVVQATLSILHPCSPRHVTKYVALLSIA